eukprot:CFRG8235T1
MSEQPPPQQHHVESTTATCEAHAAEVGDLFAEAVYATRGSRGGFSDESNDSCDWSEGAYVSSNESADESEYSSDESRDPSDESNPSSDESRGPSDESRGPSDESSASNHSSRRSSDSSRGSNDASSHESDASNESADESRKTGATSIVRADSAPAGHGRVPDRPHPPTAVADAKRQAANTKRRVRDQTRREEWDRLLTRSELVLKQYLERPPPLVDTPRPRPTHRRRPRPAHTPQAAAAAATTRPPAHQARPAPSQPRAIPRRLPSHQLHSVQKRPHQDPYIDALTRRIMGRK